MLTHATHPPGSCFITLSVFIIFLCTEPFRLCAPLQGPAAKRDSLSGEYAVNAKHANGTFFPHNSLPSRPVSAPPAIDKPASQLLIIVFLVRITYRVRYGSARFLLLAFGGRIKIQLVFHAHGIEPTAPLLQNSPLSLILYSGKQ